MKHSNFIFLYFIFLFISLNGQVTQSNEIEKGTSIQRSASFNVEEIKVRWKKAALENCTGIPCVVAPPPPSFTCGTSTITDIDLNSYSTVLIGAQCWTKQNLKVTKYNDGTLIPDLTGSTSNPWAPTSGARTEYVASGVTGLYVGTFGYLYNWYAVNDSRKLCPDGWHVPTDSDWNKLVKSIHSGADTTIVTQSTTAGTLMKSAVTNTTLNNGLGWNPASPPSPGTNTSGFTALPGGYRNPVGSFSDIRNLAFFWSATENSGDSTKAESRSLDDVSGNIYSDDNVKGIGASVRCLKD